jgi:hypothetical protein
MSNDSAGARLFIFAEKGQVEFENITVKEVEQ